MRRYPVTFALVLLLGAGFALQHVYDALAVPPDSPLPAAFAAGAISAEALRQPHRLITGSLMHGGFLHIVMNVWVLLQVGPVFELLFGSRRLAFVYAISGVLASMASSISLEPERVAVGASGAIFGIVGALLVMLGGASKQVWAKSLHTQLALWALATLVLGFISPIVDNAAHLGGLTSGVVAGLLFRAQPSGRT